MTPIPIACTCGRGPEIYPGDDPVLCTCGRRWDYRFDYAPSRRVDGNPAADAFEIPFKVQPMLALDLDGTIRFSRSGAIWGPQNENDVALFPGVEEKLWAYKLRGFRLVAISNQGVVGAGTRNEVKTTGILLATLSAFTSDPFDDYEMAYGLPSAQGGKVAPHNLRSLRRKPHYGMLVSAEAKAFKAGVQIDWDASLMVGDRPEDQACAAAAAVPFQWAWDFFERPPPRPD